MADNSICPVCKSNIYTFVWDILKEERKDALVRVCSRCRVCFHKNRDAVKEMGLVGEWKLASEIKIDIDRDYYNWR